MKVLGCKESLVSRPRDAIFFAGFTLQYNLKGKRSVEINQLSALQCRRYIGVCTHTVTTGVQLAAWGSTECALKIVMDIDRWDVYTSIDMLLKIILPKPKLGVNPSARVENKWSK